MRKTIEGITENIFKKTLFLKADTVYKDYNTKELINIIDED